MRIAAALALTAAVSACAADGGTPGPAAKAALSASVLSPQPPRYVTYRCDGGGQITLEDFRTSVHVVDTRGIDVELPAAPEGQSTRYGQPGYALILEDPRALWMVSGKKPVNCVR